MQECRKFIKEEKEKLVSKQAQQDTRETEMQKQGEKKIENPQQEKGQGQKQKNEDKEVMEVQDMG